MDLFMTYSHKKRSLLGGLAGAGLMACVAVQCTPGSGAPSAAGIESEAAAAVAPVQPSEDDFKTPALQAPAGAERTPSGIPYQVLAAPSSTARPEPHDRVRLHFTAWNKKGELLETSRTHGAPVSLVPYRLLPEWGQAVTLMRLGEQRRFWLPPGVVPPGLPQAPEGGLIFDVELSHIKPRPAPPEKPADPAVPPADAIKTASKIAYRMMRTVEEGTPPTAEDRVEVEYTIWSDRGRLLDSTVPRGRSLRFLAGKSMPGLAEAVQQLKPGERGQFWVPGELAAPGGKGEQGPFVLDLELKRVL